MGFKSFADKTSIKFEDGITCIVGPNGCGKSNVADAVRWVLGEQSAKTLRGTNMQDVIFLGTDTRRPLSYCEVTLVFDNHENENHEKLFDIEYEEVSMTRRLYRSGESEYLLNMQPCRLKDIIALLHGVGIAKEGYSIIGQGKVAQIMNAKPEDRRAIFEEATGVMAFRSRRGEIERNLESARANLQTYTQRMDETESQLRPLERQAETARKYRDFREQLQHEEVNTYLLRCDNAAYETEQQREIIRSATERLSEVEQRLGEVDAEEERSRAATAEADETLHSLNEKLRLYEVDIERKVGDSKVLSERLSNYRRELDRASDDMEQSVRRMKDIDGLVAASQKKLEGTEQQAAKLEEEYGTLLKRAQEADARYAAYERLAAERRRSELSSVENLASARLNSETLNLQRDAAQTRLEEVDTAIARVEGRIEEYNGQTVTCEKERENCRRTLDSVSEERKNLSASLEDLAESARSLTKEIGDGNAEINDLNHRLEVYRELKNRFGGYKESVRKLQIRAQSDLEIGGRIKGAIADIVSTEKRYEVAIETAFGGAMQNLVTATRDDARYLIEFLKRTHEGTVTFLPVDAIAPRGDSSEVRRALNERGALGLANDLVKCDDYYRNIVSNLLGNTLVCDNIANATEIAKRYPRSFKIVTLDGDIIAASGAMTGGSRRADVGNLLSTERQIHETEEAIFRKRGSLEKLQKALENCEKERVETSKSLSALEEKERELSSQFVALEERKAAIGVLIEEAEKEKLEYTALRDELTRRMSDISSEAELSAENEKVLSKIRTEAAQQSSAGEAEGEKLKAERDELSERQHALMIERTELLGARSSEEENIKRLTEEKEELIHKVARTKADIEQAGKSIEELKRDAERTALSEEDSRAVEALRGRIAETEQAKSEINKRQLEIAEEKRSLSTRRMTLIDQKHNCELTIERSESALENMRQHIEEEYGLTYETAQPLRDPAYDITQASSNINSLKHKIAALGSINHRAEEDYNDLLAHFTEMQTQRGDIEKSVVDLTGVLSDLKAEMQKKFDEGFDIINKNFTKIFRELFGGGRAEMQLDYTDCDDPLDAGIEIVACPPGKKLAKLSLLSGGEQAYTAIAILFAILKSRPMPFCILDEIEAALDEANVDRFARYLKNFSKDTQFIVITHRKPTMNQADVLFGVTMEEKGVSKIVSVKLSEVESRLGGDTVVA